MKAPRWRNVAALIAVAALAALAPWSRVAAQAGPAPDLARGRHIATALAGCADCHGRNFAGGRAFALPSGIISSANLTGGTGGIAALSDADIGRAIRTGMLPDGRHLRLMPVREYAALTDSDLAAVIAFLRSLPPVDNVVATPAPAAPQPALSTSAQAAQAIEGNPTGPPPVGGAYLATIGGCLSCHGAHLAGTVRPGGAIAPNISRAGIGSWTFGDFQTALRTGKTPAGTVLSAAMPWRTYANMTDAELRAIYDYIESKPARG